MLLSQVSRPLSILKRLAWLLQSWVSNPLFSSNFYSTQALFSSTGGASTIVASYLARMRGTNEPQLSIQRAKDLDQLIRQCEAFLMDHGHKTGGADEENTLQGFREKLEQLLGNADQ